MGKMRDEVALLMVGVGVILIMMSMVCVEVEAATGLQPTKLHWHYYNKTCHEAEVYVRHQVSIYCQQDKTLIPQLARLAYTDCFVSGCDASILLDGAKSEKTAAQNIGLGENVFVLIDKIKTVLEERCPGVVSCADIIHLAARDALHLQGAPAYPVFTGRKDGFKSDAASVDLPSPSISFEKALTYFKSKGLDILDMTTLLGAHTMGRANCSYIVDRLYNYQGTGKPDPTMDANFVNTMRKLCPPRKPGQPYPLAYLNPQSGSDYKFTNSYYQRILSHKAVLGVDQELLYNNVSQQIVKEFAIGFEDFRKSFALSMTRMGNIGVLTGNQGELRHNCRKPNNGHHN